MEPVVARTSGAVEAGSQNEGSVERAHEDSVGAHCPTAADPVALGGMILSGMVFVVPTGSGKAVEYRLGCVEVVAELWSRAVVAEGHSAAAAVAVQDVSMMAVALLAYSAG